MSQWFGEIASLRDPQPSSLKDFLLGTEAFMDHFISEMSARRDERRWRELLYLARGSFEQDVRPAFERVREGIDAIPAEIIAAHGLRGLPLRFKYEALDYLATHYEDPAELEYSSKPRWTGLPDLVRRILEVIDAILESIFAGVPGGGLIVEYKDTLRALQD